MRFVSGERADCFEAVPRSVRVTIVQRHGAGDSLKYRLDGESYLSIWFLGTVFGDETSGGQCDKSAVLRLMIEQCIRALSNQFCSVYCAFQLC